MKSKKVLAQIICFMLISLLISVSVYSEEIRVEADKGEPELIFHGIGKIDSSADKNIVIDGKVYILASHFKYLFFNDNHTFPNEFKPGTTVAYQLDENKNISSIWIIKEKDLDAAKKILDAQKWKKNEPYIPKN